jgi:hypothetical protein
MIWNLIVSTIIIIACIFGLVYWWNNGENFINNFLDSNNCHIGTPNSLESSCTFGQVAFYIVPYFFLIGLISIGVAVIYSSCRPVMM